MSEFKECPICKKYAFMERHHCAPIYFFKHDDWGTEFVAIRAFSFHDAAEEFAKKYNENGDYALMGSEQEVIISDGKVEKIFIVSAEQDICYSVIEKNNSKERKALDEILG